ncbi:MAG: TIR domain-containing protein, partial [Clostridia bacterium]|nr:TIR domain-containing protein [Clostridia bacterium]
MIIKCKMCGGDLVFQPGDTYGKCDSCDSVCTIPTVQDEQELNRYNRANHFRRQCDFDKAVAAYEKILEGNEGDAEAHWGIVLSRFGIEYVEDPATGRRVPTCHRLQVSSVLTDADYLAALENAPDNHSRELYEQQAHEIAAIQKGILAISRNEQPFDVFICYKETDAAGQRTRDSQLAQDIYYALTDEGYRVFFSRITLEDKLGQQYEPYIFAALQSARVMLVVGTRPEHFSAVWVKNEWSRYLHIMKNDRSRLLIPCYRDMDPYDLPEEMSSLQSQDMGRIGFIQDLLRGIKKVLKTEEKPAAPVQQVVVQQAAAEGAGNVAALLDRAFMALEDGEFGAAVDFCEQVLNQDARNARAYLGKLMAGLRVRLPEQLGQQTKTFDQDSNYQKIMRFGDDALKKQMQGYHQAIADRQEKARRDAVVNEALQWLGMLDSIRDYSAIKERIEKKMTAIGGTEEEKQVMAACAEKEKELLEKQYQQAVKYFTAGIWKSAQGMFAALGDYRDSREKAAESLEAERNEKYSKAQSLMNKQEYTLAEEAFVALGDYRDCREKVAQCRELRQEMLKKIAEAELKRTAEAAAKKARKKRKILIAAAIAVLLVTAILVVTKVIIPMGHYNSAEQLLAKGDQISALTFYQKAGNYRDSVAKQRDILAKQRDVLSSLSVKVSAGYSHTVGLKADGTVMAVGDNDDGQCNVSSWRDIVAVSAGDHHTVGLKADGTVMAVGDNDDGQCNVSGWRDIVAVSAGFRHTVGLKADGTVVAVGSNSLGQCNVSSWRDIVAVSAGYHTVGLKADGTVMAVGNNDDGRCSVSSWRGIVAVSAGSYHTVGLKADGTVVAVGPNSHGRCNVSSWRDIVSVS